MVSACPLCSSKHIRSKQPDKHVGSFFNAVTGATSGAAFAMASTNAHTGTMAHALSALCGAVIGGAVGYTSGGLLAKVHDHNTLHCFECLDCGCLFQRRSF